MLIFFGGEVVMEQESRRCPLRLGLVSRGNERKGQGMQLLVTSKHSSLPGGHRGTGHVLLMEFPSHRRRYQGRERDSPPNEVMDKNKKEIPVF